MKKRKKVIVNPKIQFKMIFLIFISTIMPTFLTFISLHFILQSIILEAKLNNPLLYNSLITLSHKVYIILIIGFTLIASLLITWSMIFIHRIVGPLYRLEKELDKAIKGKKIKKINFRKNDCFASLADKINILIKKINV